ncbi:hypothetical protein BSKO_11221 [Bryopsis sp. KO-2023]|nr:hypothetical protein BSKO_11221 [Bryopsis sp. KO-2023]
MSIVGELPLDISRPAEFASGDFDPPACGHHRQPSHRRTPSQFMILFDESFMGAGPPSPPRDHFPVSLAQSAPLTKESLDRKHKMESAVASQTLQPIAVTAQSGSQTPTAKFERKSKKHHAKKAGKKPDIQQLYSNMWGGAVPKPTPRAKSESNLSLASGRSPRGVGKIFGFLQRRSLDVETTRRDFPMDEPTVDRAGETLDDCESETGTVVEFDIDSDDEMSSQAEDANMMHDLYSDKDKASVEEEESYSNDSIDEDEFPLGPIEESALEAQKLCESEFSDDSSMEVTKKRRSSEIHAHAHTKSTIQEDDESEPPIKTAEDGMESVHSHNPSDGSQLESDIPLREIVTGSILQGVHDEISQKIAEELENAAKEAHEDQFNTEAPIIADRELEESIEYVESSAQSSREILESIPGIPEASWWGLKWARVDPDKDFVEKVHSGLETAGKLIAKHWRLVPLVALPLVFLVLTN